MTPEQKAEYWKRRNNVETVKRPDPKTGKIKEFKVKRPLSGQGDHNPVVNITLPQQVQSVGVGERKILRKGWKKDRKRPVVIEDELSNE